MNRPTKATGAYWYDQAKHWEGEYLRVCGLLREERKVRQQLADALTDIRGYSRRPRRAGGGGDVSRADDLQAAYNNGQFFGHDEVLLLAAIPDLLAVVRVLERIADPSYVGNYAPLAVIEIYRRWTAQALAAFEAGGKERE